MLKTALVLLLLPPVNLACFALAGLIIGRRYRFGRTIVAVSVLGLVLLSFHAVTRPMLTSLERDLPIVPPPDAPPAAIVVLGGDTLESPSVPDGFTIGMMTLQRLTTAADVHRRTGLPVLVSGGRVPPEAPPLAGLMARSLRQDFGVTVQWAEQTSRDTWENAHLSAAMLRAEGIGSVYVVTHGWHMKRALEAFRRTGVRATAAPTPLLQPLDTSARDFLPSVMSWVNGYLAAHEWVGRLWYALA